MLTLGHPAAVLGMRQVGSVATLSPGGKGGSQQPDKDHFREGHALLRLGRLWVLSGCF